MRKLKQGYYICEHNCGVMTVIKKNNKWVVAEECTGEVYWVTNTKKRAADLILQTFGA
tara:strand:- start:3498 stop:3671 length:174 start_codon:yes stop_codon:yes gene_type:complete